MLTLEENILVSLLKDACCIQNNSIRHQKRVAEEMTAEQWHKVIRLAQTHKVLSLCYDVLQQYPSIPEGCLNICERSSRQTVYNNYRLLFLTKYVVSLLLEAGIAVIVLKGEVTALLYPVPELRKSGDVDLLLEKPEALTAACTILEENGFQIKDQQAALHHITFSSGEGITIELHGMIAEPFDNRKINLYLERLIPEMFANGIEEKGWGFPLPSLAQGYHAFYLLLHMLQHFLRYGFGLKYLCDWVVFWNRQIDKEQSMIFLRLVSESGILGFAKMITAVCVEYLGLKKEKVAFLKADKITKEQKAELLKEIIEAGEFGKAQKDRMVAMRSGKVVDFFREFHHQMGLNYPNVGRVILLWPILWGLTFYRFWRNNRSLRKVSSIAILRKAAKRSYLVKQMKLFENKTN